MSSLFPDRQTFIENWREILDQLPVLDRGIVEAILSGTHSLVELGATHGVSRERIRQRHARAVKRIQSILEDQPDGPVAQAVVNLTDLTEITGLYLAPRQRTKESRNQSTRLLTEQLSYLGVAYLDDQHLVGITTTLIPVPKPELPELTHLVNAVDQALEKYPEGATAQRLMDDLTPVWRFLMGKWPRLQLELHIQAHTGLTPDLQTGVYPPGIRMVARHRDVTLIHHYLVQVLQREQHPMSITELVIKLNHAVLQDGHDYTYTRTAVRKGVGDRSRLKWAGNSTYALREWAKGLSDPSRMIGRRPQIADEIVHFIRTNGKPMTMEAINKHIESRLSVASHSVYMSIRVHSKHFQILSDGTVDLADQHK